MCNAHRRRNLDTRVPRRRGTHLSHEVSAESALRMGSTRRRRAFRLRVNRGHSGAGTARQSQPDLRNVRLTLRERFAARQPAQQRFDDAEPPMVSGDCRLILEVHMNWTQLIPPLVSPVIGKLAEKAIAWCCNSKKASSLAWRYKI